MALEKAKLGNELDIYVDQVDSIDNIVSMSVPFGSADEDFGDEGVAHAIEHCVHLRTDAFASQYEVDQFASLNGLVTDATTSYTNAQYVVAGIGLEESINYLSEILQRTHLPGNMVEGEMQVVRGESRMRMDDPENLHWLSVNNAMFGYPFGRDITGYHDRLNFDASELRRLHERYYKVGRMSLVVSGYADIEEVAKLAERYFEPDGKSPEDESAVLNITNGEHFRTGFVLGDVSSVQLSVGFPLDPNFRDKVIKNRLAYQMASDVMNGAASRRLREDMQISYDGDVYLSISGHTEAWRLGGNVSVDADDVALAEEAFRIVFSTGSSGYTSDDINGVLALNRYSLLKTLSSSEGRAAMHMQRLESGINPEDIRSTMDQLLDVSEDDVRRAIDDIVEYTQRTDHYTHLTGAREDIGSVDRIIQRSDII